MANHLYDTHFHLDLFKSTDEIINAIEKNQIYTIAVTNLPVLFKKLNDTLSSKYIRPALGFHPELLAQYKHHIPQMWDMLNEARYIGEIGLDFKIGKESKELQLSFFTELIERCNEHNNKILTIHSRQSANDVVSIIGSSFRNKVILHWYSGSIKTLKQALENGYYFSINYSMINSDSGKSLIKQIPLERMLLETDAPFIQYNGKPFTPLDIKHIVYELSKFLEIDYNKMASILWANFKGLLE
ncbi:TatD family hydrolase [Maribellus sp. CM-23]|uniref:Qat anti-phage system TatD family nuclease QatD n=1 Tax=Maribellus sp. CM-23 TaxID=2781026 RepID=UPI001F2DC875|nr:Qat anti-phage system TatD family nuclease QatD [Maribellus sp. CM-23]MCE4564349.1 TatD family hydrolase [Maribellus sp. CM-23]